MLYLDLAAIAHRHGDTWTPMEEVEATSPADIDPERKLTQGARIFRCSTCDVEIRIATPTGEINDR